MFNEDIFPLDLHSLVLMSSPASCLLLASSSSQSETSVFIKIKFFIIEVLNIIDKKNQFLFIIKVDFLIVLFIKQSSSLVYIQIQ